LCCSWVATAARATTNRPLPKTARSAAGHIIHKPVRHMYGRQHSPPLSTKRRGDGFGTWFDKMGRRGWHHPRIINLMYFWCHGEHAGQPAEGSSTERQPSMGGSHSAATRGSNIDCSWKLPRRPSECSQRFSSKKRAKLASKVCANSRFSSSFLILAFASFSSFSLALDTYSNTTVSVFRFVCFGLKTGIWCTIAGTTQNADHS